MRIKIPLKKNLFPADIECIIMFVKLIYINALFLQSRQMKKVVTFFIFAFLCLCASSFAQTLANTPWPMRGQNNYHTGRGTSFYSTSGTLKWAYATSDAIISSPTIGSDGTLYLGSYDNYLYAVNPTGTLKWKYPTGNIIWSSPAIASDGTIYIGSGDNYLYAVNSNGTLKWRYLTGNWVYSSPAIGSDGTIYAGSYDNYLYAINPNGTLKWRYLTGNSIYSSPAIGPDGTIYVGSADNYLYAINPANGTLRWRYNTGNWVYSSPAVGTDGTVYVGSGDTYLHAVNPNGTFKWKYQTGNTIISSPSIGSDGTVYVGSYDKYLYAVNPNGSLKWKYQTGNSIYSSPAIGTDGVIYVGSLDSYFYAIKPDGIMKWRFATSDGVYSSPSIGSDGTIFTGSYDHYLYAFNPESPSITLTEPNGGEIWIAGTSHNINWTSINIPTVKIEYTLDSGLNWTTIIGNAGGPAGLYQWPIPNISSADCKIRVSDSSNGLVNDISDSLLTILPQRTITVTSPNGGEVLTPYTQHQITWLSTTVDSVKIDFFNGTVWTPVIQKTPSDGAYVWTVPAVTSSNCSIRITDITDSLVTDACNAPFSVILPTINITSPNGGEHWIVGSVQNILWTSTLVTNVKIEYSTDNGTGWTTITASTPSNGFFSWTVPNLSSKNCLIRISHSVISHINDVSNSIFNISPPPSLTVVTPNGSDVLVHGSTKTIIWSSSNVDNIKIEYSPDNGANWLTIVTSMSAVSGSYIWTVPNTISPNCILRISDISNVQINDISNGIFSIIPPSITVTYPNGGETLTAGSSYDIIWTSLGVTNIKIEYSSNNGSTWLPVAATTSAAAGHYSWAVPNTPSVNCLIKISDSSNTQLNDISNSVFIISSPPSVTVTSPNGGETWIAGTSHNITWTAILVANIKIEYSINNGTSWTTIIPTLNASSGSYSWVVPNIPSAACLIRISNSENSSVTDISNAVFTISPAPTITVTSPDGGENWMMGTNQNITWTSINVSNVKIDYSVNNGSTYTTIVASTPSDGSYSWVVPNTVSDICRIRISDASNNQVNDTGNAVFTISPLPSITVTSPNGGENWMTGTNHEIKWTSVNVENVKIEYSTNGGTNFTTIISSTPSDSLYSWNVPNLPSASCLIRISDASNSQVTDTGNAVFTISLSPSITIVSPNGGEKWVSLTSHTISWTSQIVSKVTIQYSEDNGINWNKIVSNLDAVNGSYTWTIPEMESSKCLIRVKDSSDSQIFDTSDNLFEIQSPPSVTVISPHGGEKWIAGAENEIKWSDYNVSAIKIEYTLNNGAEWISLVSGLDASLKSYIWAVPDTVSSQCLVKITDMSTLEINDTSNSAFTIKKLEPPSDFSAVYVPETNSSQIKLSWSLSPDDNSMGGYRLYRSRLQEFVEPAVDINTILTPLELSEKELNSTILITSIPRGETVFVDETMAESGVEYYYWIESFMGDLSSVKIRSGKTVSVKEEFPVSYIINGPYPNPFNPVTTISYTIPAPAYVSLSVYSLSGQKVTSLSEGFAGAGTHEVIFDGSGLASGVYLYRFESGGFRKSGKMLLMK